MKPKKILALTAIFALLLPLLSAFGPGTKTADAAGDAAPVLLNYPMDYEGSSSYVSATEYTYSRDGIIVKDFTFPADADWIVASRYYSSKWNTSSSNEKFVYSNFGTIAEVDDPTHIPPTAAWVALSSMQLAADPSSDRTFNPTFFYSLNGSDRQTASDALHIPGNARWALLAGFQEGAGSTASHPNTAAYSLNRTSPTAQSLKIVSSSSHSGYAKEGEAVTLMLQTDIAIPQPKLRIGDVGATVTGSGRNWSGALVLDDTFGDGELAVTAEFYSPEGAPGFVQATTDGSKVVKDTMAPLLSTSLDPEGAARDDVMVFVTAEDAGSGVEEIKWAKGALTSADFAFGGETLPLDDPYFYVEENGTYSVYARDLLGNEKVIPVNVSTIDRVSPTVKLTPSTTDPTGEPVTVKVDVEDAESGVDEVSWSAREREPDSPWKGQEVKDGQFTATANGTYTVIAWDRAGNEAIKKIVISNILSPNANLDRLTVSDGQQELALTPVFDPARTDYQLNVANGVSSIRIAAKAGEQTSSVNVNGRTVAPGGTSDVNLVVGANTVTISVTAPLATAKKTYTIIVNRAAGASSGEVSAPTASGSSAAAAPPEKTLRAFRAELNGKALSGKANEELVTVRKAASNGSIEYEIQLNEASEILAQAPKGVANELSLKRDPAVRVDALTLRISKQAQAQLKEGQIGLVVDLGGFRYKLPAGFSADGGGDLLAKLTLLPSEGSEVILRQAASRFKQGEPPRLVGSAASFESNAINSAGSEQLIIPLPEGLDAVQTKNLAVFVQEANGADSILPATLQYSAQGQATGAVVNIERSGRIALLQAGPTITQKAGYVQGISSESFAPNRAVTRAELAALLNKLSEPSAAVSPGVAGASFQDLPPSSWAASSVARVTESGWMSGGGDGRFRPNDALTRGELAVVLMRWKQVQAEDDLSSSFVDAIPAWAAEAAASAERQGWIKGYADGSFRANQSVTRAEVVAILNRATGRPGIEDDGIALWSDIPKTHWAVKDIRAASRTIEIRTYLDGKIEATAK